MQEKLTILVSAEHKRFIKRHAKQHNKSVSKFIDDLLASIKRDSKRLEEKDEWLEKAAGIYNTGHKDILNDLFKGIKKS